MKHLVCSNCPYPRADFAVISRVFYDTRGEWSNFVINLCRACYDAAIGNYYSPDKFGCTICHNLEVESYTKGKIYMYKIELTFELTFRESALSERICTHFCSKCFYECAGDGFIPRFADRGY